MEQTRGSKPLYRGASKGCKSKAGNSFSASGYSSNAGSSIKNNATYEKIDEIDFTIQIVNNEEEEQLLHISKMIQDQVDSYRMDEANKLRRMAEELEKKSARSELLALSQEEIESKFRLN